MIYRTDHRQALAVRGARALARIVDWRFVERPALIPPVLAPYQFDLYADVVLIPAGEGVPRGLGSALSQIRCTAVVVMPGFTTAGHPTWYFIVAYCGAGKLAWHSGLRLFALAEGKVCLVPDPVGASPEAVSFCIDKGRVKPASAPWSSVAEWHAGIAEGDALMVQMAERS